MRRNCPISISNASLGYLRKIIFVLLFVFCFFSPSLSLADLNANVSISATIASPGSGNNNGDGEATSTHYVVPTDITFSGFAYPKARIILLSGGIKIFEIDAGTNSYFSLNLGAVIPGMKVFSIVAEDLKGTRSILVSLPIKIEDQTSTIISNLFIPPTISTDKKFYGRGEEILVKGYSVSGSKVSLDLDLKNILSGQANNLGEYAFKINTDSLPLGEHSLQVKAETAVNNKPKVSGWGKINYFTITLNKTKDIENKNEIFSLADVNNDSVINIVDFSILASWYKKPQPPKNLDLNGDGKITIADFSILAYYWNG